jgi:sortase A
MVKYHYKKSKNNLKNFLRFAGGLFLITGIFLLLYTLLPLISWQIYFKPVFAYQNILTPIPNANIADLTKNLTDSTDYTRAENWFQNFDPQSKTENDISSYTISIPKIKIENAIVSTTDTDLKKHLVNYKGTGIPGESGNAVIFGHSTLPQLFNPGDYKTIFANLYKLKNGDTIYATINNTIYTYKIFKTIVVNPQDNSALTQNYDDSYLTLVTCTPPGTTWKRLVISAKLEKI